MSRSIKDQESTEQRHLRIYKTIRERISLLNYEPGKILSETSLAKEFNVSRTPIRNVLQRLHYEGLVEIRNGVGTIVKDIDLKTLKEIYDLRMHLAELMGELSPTEFSQSQLTRLERILKNSRTLRKKMDYEKYARCCNDLEEVLITMIGNSPLREMTDVLYYRVSRIWFSFLPQLNWEEMVYFLEDEISSIIDAVKQNDLKKIGQIRRAYLNRILNYLSNYLTN